MNMMSLAQAMPTRCGSVYIRPVSGMMPILVNAAPKRAVFDTNTRSLAAVIDSPAPKASPSTAAMKGLEPCVMPRSRLCTCFMFSRTVIGVLGAVALAVERCRSAPTQK